jgi:Zn-dependent metalloprotease
MQPSRFVRRAALSSLAAAVLAFAAGPAAGQRPEPDSGRRSPADPMAFVASGHTVHGDWTASVSLDRSAWSAGAEVVASMQVGFAAAHLASLSTAGIAADKLCVLMTAERTFDADGWLRLASDERMSTLLTPTGLAIEGGVQGALTTRYGYQFASPVDQLVSVSTASIAPADSSGARTAAFVIRAVLPAALPPGLYRLRFDIGVMAGTRVYNFNGYTFAARPFSTEAGTSTYFYSPIIPASGTHVSGRLVHGPGIRARIPWVLLYNYSSNGYKGVVADEDARRFATSDRSLIPDEVILPMYDDSGNRLSYSLEPQFPTDTIDSLQNVAWSWDSGELSVQVAGPDRSLVDLGTAPFVAKGTNGPTTKQSAFTAWKPQAYGRYTVTATGWIRDADGRRYEGGGTYHFWVAKRMTLATATFQGMPYPVGSAYGRDIQFNPAVAADVQVTASLYVNSDPTNVRTTTYSGKASTAGLFGAAQGMKSFPLDAPGEYHAKVLATYTDADGHLWVSTMRHAGIVYPEPSAVTARGKKLAVGSQRVDRGDTKFEGYIEPDGTQHLSHISFPYNSGDVLLIGAEGQAANKIEPVLTYQMQGDTSAWDTRLDGVGTTNLRIKTSNGYSPHLFPEYITDVEYYYGAAPRPGFMGRFIVGESVTRAPYWPVSPNSFGGQIGASPNGDAPGDIYRLLGGVVLRRVGQSPLYAGYIASAFLLPKGSNNNRIVAAGAEDLNGPLGDKARFFLVGLRPGTAFEVGSTFRPALQIDPLLPVSIHFVLTYPDGRRQVADGVGDRFGSFAGPTAWPLDVPGVYRYQVSGSWNGFPGRMPGLPDAGGEFFVYSGTRPAGSSGLRVDGSSQRTFSASTGTTITGSSTAASVHYTLITPGAVIEQGELLVKSGKFSYVFSPEAVHAKVPLYDITSITTGKPQIGRVLHLTFFSQEAAAGGSYFDVARVILRGTTLLSSRTLLPMSAIAAAPSATGVDLSNQDAPGSGERFATRIVATDQDSVRAGDALVDRLVRSRDLVVVDRWADGLIGSRVHERLQQFHKGVPVFGAVLTRQMQAGRTVSIFGRLHEDIAIDAVPRLSAEAARVEAARCAADAEAIASLPSLAVLPLDEGGYALAWRAEIRSGADVRACFVSAATGGVLLNYSELRTQRPATAHAVVYDLRGDVRRAAGAVARTVRLAAADVAVDGTIPGDHAAADARAALEATYAFYSERFGRLGADGKDGPTPIIVHPADPEDWRSLGSRYGFFFAGGAWDGEAIVLGAGLPDGERAGGRTWRSAASALDIVAHEFAHAVLDHSSRLVYRGESGALAEAFADAMATGVEFSAQPPGRGTGRADYEIGEDAAGADGLRSLANPGASGHPDHVSRIVATADDNGGVHQNATVAGHAYFLAIEGGTNRSSGLQVQGVGRERRDQVERAFYRAFVYLLPSAADFAMAREATIQSAVDLYGENSAAVRAIGQAWAAVDVGR